MSSLEERVEELEMKVVATQRATSKAQTQGRVLIVLIGLAAVVIPTVGYTLDPVPHPPVEGSAIRASEVQANFEHLVEAVTDVESRLAEAEVALAVNSATATIAGMSVSTSSTSIVAVPDLEVQLTTGGGEVVLQLQPNGPDTAFLTSTKSASGGAFTTIQFRRDNTVIAAQRTYTVNNGGSPALDTPLSAFSFIDSPPAGTYQYQVYWATGGGSGAQSTLHNAEFVAREIPSL